MAFEVAPLITIRISAESLPAPLSLPQVCLAWKTICARGLGHLWLCFVAPAIGEQPAGWEAQASCPHPGDYYLFGVHAAGAQVRCRNPHWPRLYPHLASFLARTPSR